MISGTIAGKTTGGTLVVDLGGGRWGLADRFGVAASRTPRELRVGDRVEAELTPDQPPAGLPVRLHNLGILPIRQDAAPSD